MSTLGQGQHNGGGITLGWIVRGPRFLTAPDAWRALYQAALRPRLDAVRAQMQSSAASAYSDTRFGATFGSTVATSPYARVSLYNTSPTFPYVENPTRPHVIRARNGPFLHFKIGDRWVRVAAVQHPGTRGRLALPPIYARAELAFQAALIASAQEALSRE